MIRKLIAIVVLLLLTGCMAKMSYDFADWVIEWMVDDYVSLDKAQQKQLKLDIDKHLAWHKQTQLIRYRDWLIEFREQAAVGLNREWLLSWSEQLPFFWQDIALQINPDTIILLGSFSDQQVDEVITNLEKSQRELEEEYLDPDEATRLQERLERTEDFVNNLLGKLTRQQRDIIGQWNNESGDSTRLWLENRQHWTQIFDQTLRDREGDNFDEEITELFVYPERLWTEQYQQSVEKNFNAGINLVLAIEPTITEKQRKKLNKFLNKWIDVLDDLAR